MNKACCVCVAESDREENTAFASDMSTGVVWMRTLFIRFNKITKANGQQLQLQQSWQILPHSRSRYTQAQAQAHAMT